ncbi:hypothetical protein ABZV64_24715 [Streptomyces sp. NPDC004959]|uniref:hypothetical protein n=1 Tax=unclassified Streptomyces TaxID=2593676 RepID=UPI0004CA9299|nr:hypothetical protein [Streptomyces sp. NRRL F-5630]
MLALLLLLLVPLAALALCGVVIAVLVGALSLALPGGRPREPGARARWGACLLAVLAASVYVLGAGLVLFDVNESSHGAASSPAPACRDAGPATVAGLRDSRASYLPLGFTCVREDGSTYAGEPVLRWCNSIGLGGTAGAVLLGGVALGASRRRPPRDGAPHQGAAPHGERPGAPGPR